MPRVRLRHHRREKIPDLPSGPRRVKVGFPAGGPGEAPGGDGEARIIDIAIWNHYGTRTIPERPFLENAMRDNRSAYRAAMGISAPKILRGQTSLRTVLSKLGILAQGHVQAEITALRTPPNAPETIRRKGSSNPLIDEGTMRQAVTWEIEE